MKSTVGFGKGKREAIVCDNCFREAEVKVYSGHEKKGEICIKCATAQGVIKREITADANTKVVTTRKVHMCIICKKNIKKGSRAISTQHTAATKALYQEHTCLNCATLKEEK